MVTGKEISLEIYVDRSYVESIIIEKLASRFLKDAALTRLPIIRSEDEYQEDNRIKLVSSQASSSYEVTSRQQKYHHSW